ncbi:MAG: FmdB family zinc ribbon protein [Actinomycetes bacterium]
MPTYQYACLRCSHRFEAVQAFADDSLTECPECGGELRKVYSAVGVVFKGSGFYRTDSRADGADKARAGGRSTNGSGEPVPAGTSKTSTADGGTATSSESKGAASGATPAAAAASPKSSSTSESAA